jgi:hypothetical protein
MTIRKIVLLVVLIVSLSSSLAQPPQVVQTQLDIMLRAVKDNIYASFVSAGTDGFKTTYLQDSFVLLHDFVASRLAQGYEATYLESLNMRGYTVFLWKLSYTDDGDDSLVSLSVENGFVAGFLIQ